MQTISYDINAKRASLKGSFHPAQNGELIDESHNRIFDLRISPIKYPDGNPRQQPGDKAREFETANSEKYGRAGPQNEKGLKSNIKTRPPPYQALDMNNTSMEVRYRKYVTNPQKFEPEPRTRQRKPPVVPEKVRGSYSLNNSVNDSITDADYRFLSQNSIDVSQMQENSLLDNSYNARQTGLKNQRGLKKPENQVFLNIVKKGMADVTRSDNLQIIPDDLKVSVDLTDKSRKAAYETIEPLIPVSKPHFATISEELVPLRQRPRHAAAGLSVSIDSHKSEELSQLAKKSLKSNVLLEKIQEKAMKNFKNGSHKLAQEIYTKKEPRTKSVPTRSSKGDSAAFVKTSSDLAPHFRIEPISKPIEHKLNGGITPLRDEAAVKLKKVRSLFFKFRDTYLKTNAHFENKAKERKAQPAKNYGKSELKQINIGCNMIHRVLTRKWRKIFFNELSNYD